MRCSARWLHARPVRATPLRLNQKLKTRGAIIRAAPHTERDAGQVGVSGQPTAARPEPASAHFAALERCGGHGTASKSYDIWTHLTPEHLTLQIVVRRPSFRAPLGVVVRGILILLNFAFRKYAMCHTASARRPPGTRRKGPGAQLCALSRDLSLAGAQPCTLRLSRALSLACARRAAGPVPCSLFKFWYIKFVGT